MWSFINNTKQAKSGKYTIPSLYWFILIDLIYWPKIDSEHL